MRRFFGPNYYNHSNYQPAYRRGLACAALLLVACGASNSQIARSARRVPVAHISELPLAERATALGQLPVILEIRKGDRFPLEVVIDSRLLALHTEGSWSVEALETFYMLLREEGAPAFSEDGVDFDEAQGNSFGVGFESKAGQPAKLRVALGWHANRAPAAR